MRQASEDNGSRAAASGVTDGLQHLAGFSHVAYCVGPFQLAFLLSSLQVSGIAPASCMVLPFAAIRGVPNEDLLRDLRQVCRKLGMETTDASLLSSPTLERACSVFRDTERYHNSAFWYCKGGLWPLSALSHLLKVLPDVVFEYYDGLGSCIAASEQERKRISLSHAHDLGALRQLAVQRLMQPDRCFMPDDGLWQKYAPTEIQQRTHYLPLGIIQDKIRLVGETLDEIHRGAPLEDAPGAILLTGVFSEWRKSVALVDELNMYADILAVIRAASHTTPILVKTHPRTLPQKTQGLGDICAKYNARLDTRQQLVEYILEKSGRHDVTIIGPPSTALLSTLQFRYGRPFCLSQSFMASYIGPDYGGDAWQGMHHQVMEEAGIPVIDSLTELSDFLREQ